MRFTKMHGLGNDYIYFNCLNDSPENPGALSVKLSDRHFGIGGDGIVLILPGETGDFRMRMFNADGSEGKMCGNASRCIGKYVYEKGLTDKTDITLDTLAGQRQLHLDVFGGKVTSVSVDMGRASFSPKNVPVLSEKNEVVLEPVSLCGKDWKITCVSVGNPHCVIFTKGIDGLDLPDIGSNFENHTAFPERINTEFAELIDSTHIKMRVWERGSGETLACGTGASACVAAAVKCGLCPAEEFITVSLIGGELSIMCRSDYSLVMRGGASFVFEGETLCDND